MVVGPWTRRVGLAAVTAVVIATAVATTSFADIGTKPQRTWSTNGRVTSILPVGGLVYIAGSFTQVIDTAGHANTVSNVAVFNPANGTFNPSWGAGANNLVNSLAVSGSTLYLGGNFSQADGVARKRLAAVNISTGALVAGWHPGADGQVDQIAVVGTNVYAAGIFLNVTDNAGTYAQPYIARFDASTGADDRSWRPAPNDRVRAVLGSSNGSRIYLGGDFTSVSNVSSANKTASIVTSSGAVDTAFKPGPNNQTGHSPVFDLATDGSHLLVAAGGGGGACASQDPATGRTLWSDHSNGNQQAVEIVGQTVYCGGHFSGTNSFDGADRKKMAAVDLATGNLQSFSPVINSALGVWSISSDSTHVFIGGDFTKVTGIAQPHFAQFTDLGAQTAPLAPGTLTAEGGDGDAFLAWSPPSSDGGSPITTYQVYRAVGAGQLTKIGTSNSTAYTDGTAANGTTYTYAVAATNAIGTGPQSNTATATPTQGSTTVPGAPTGLTATGGAGDIQLAWSPPSNNGHSPITNYQVLRGTSAGHETPLTTIGSTTSYDDLAVTVGTRYFYVVKAVNAVGTGAASAEASAQSAAGVPTAPVLSGVAGTGKITLTWTAPADNGSPITKYALVKDGIRIANPSAGSTSYVDPVAKGTPHSYQLKAVNAVGASKYSNTVTLTAK